MTTLTSSELAPRHNSVQPPTVEDCSGLRRQYAELTRSSRVSDKRPPQNAGPLSDDEATIYRAILEQWLSRDETTSNVSLQTFPLEVIFESGDSIPCECISSFDAESLITASHSIHNLTREILPRKDISLVDLEQRAAVARRTSDQVRGITPAEIAEADIANGFFSLSEVAFDRQHRYAVVKYSFQCGTLCGSGRTILFEKVGSEWKKMKAECGGWIS
jgi:hypothetical protein